MLSSLRRVLLGIVIALVAPIAVVLVMAVLILLLPSVGRYALSQALIRGGPLVGCEVRFGRIEGDIVQSITLTDLALKLGPDSLKVRKLTLTYDPVASIVHRCFSASAARAVEPRFFISSVRPGSDRRGTSRSQYPPIRIGQLRLSGGSVYLDTALRLDSVDLVLNLVSEPAQVQAQLSDVRALLCRERVSLRNLGGSARLTPDSLVVTDLVATTGASSLRAGLKMAFQPNALAVQLESLSISLPELTAAAPVGQPASAAPVGQRTPIPGRLRLKGTAKLEKNQASGSVQCAAEGLVWRTIELPTISGKLGLKDSVVQVTVAGADSGLGSADVTGRLDLRNLDFSVSAQLAGISVRRLDSVLPDVRVDADLDVSGRGLDSIAATVNARIPDLDIDTLTVAGSYRRAGERVAIEQLELSGPVGVVSGHGTWQGGRVQADVQMDSFDLGLLGKLLGTVPMRGQSLQGWATGSLSVAGTAETLDAVSELSVADLGIAGVSAAKAHVGLAVAIGRELSGQVRVAVTRASYGGFPLDSVQLVWHEQRFEVLGTVLMRGQSPVQVVAEGRARLARDSISIDVAALRITAGAEALAFNDALQLRLRHDSLDVRFAASGLAGGDVRAAFASTAENPPRIEAAVSRVDLAKLKVLLGFGFDVSGTVSLDVAGSDTLLVTMDAERLSIPSAEVEMSRVQGAARVSRTRAEIDHLWLVHLDSSAVPETSVIAGSLGYKTEGGFELGAADLRARLRNPGAWVVFYLKRFIELRQGAIFGDLALKGSLTRPAFEGRVRISRARLGVPVIGATFDRVNAELVFDRSRINIEKLTGRSDHGNVLVTGFVDIGQKWQVDSLRFHGDFSGTTINPQPEIYGVIGGSLDVDWTPGRPFSLSGTVDVEEALVAFGFGQTAGTGTGALDTALVYDIRVRGERDIWLRNKLADIEFAADLTVRKTTTDVLYSGELTSRQGTVYYLDQALRVTSGSVKFENINTLNPDFNVTAELPIRAVPGDAKVPGKVVLTLTGTLAQPAFGFRSEPPIWDETAIASYLSLNVIPGQLDSTDAVTKLLSQRLLSYFQMQVSKRARGFVNLDYLEFESGFLGRETKVTVGKYVGRNLYVSYTQNFTPDLNPSFRVEYYINRKNEILAEGTAGVPYRSSLRYQFKLRY
jgi:autotransporter translocation and assembly factor TamB